MSESCNFDADAGFSEVSSLGWGGRFSPGVILFSDQGGEDALEGVDFLCV
jgi:hypothetical protein